VNLDIMRNGAKIGSLSPGTLQYAVQGQTRLEAAVHSEILRDIFVALQSSQGDQLSFNVKVNPMISWTWAGFVLTILGAGLAAWPKKRPEPAVVSLKAAPAKSRKK
jgi:cytochrome c-type biogenesis protein CcmF